jgi:hypothetical protein
MIMEGYVMNASPTWVHAMKRAIGPGAKIELDELYEQYGKKHNLAEGEQFVQWLRTVKLRDTSKWKIVHSDGEKTPEKEEEPKTSKPKKPVPGGANVNPMVASTMDVADVVELSVRKGREVIPTIKDLNLLKYAYQEASQRAGKDSLCRIIRKRIRELQISR